MISRLWLVSLVLLAVGCTDDTPAPRPLPPDTVTAPDSSAAEEEPVLLEPAAIARRSAAFAAAAGPTVSSVSVTRSTSVAAGWVKFKVKPILSAALEATQSLVFDYHRLAPGDSMALDRHGSRGNDSTLVRRAPAGVASRWKACVFVRQGNGSLVNERCVTWKDSVGAAVVVIPPPVVTPPPPPVALAAPDSIQIRNFAVPSWDPNLLSYDRYTFRKPIAGSSLTVKRFVDGVLTRTDGESRDTTTAQVPIPAPGATRRLQECAFVRSGALVSAERCSNIATYTRPDVVVTPPPPVDPPAPAPADSGRSPYYPGWPAPRAPYDVAQVRRWLNPEGGAVIREVTVDQSAILARYHDSVRTLMPALCPGEYVWQTTTFIRIQPTLTAPARCLWLFLTLDLNRDAMQADSALMSLRGVSVAGVAVYAPYAWGNLPAALADLDTLQRRDAALVPRRWLPAPRVTIRLTGKADPSSVGWLHGPMELTTAGVRETIHLVGHYDEGGPP